MHQVKPECMEEYLQLTGEQLVQVSEDSEIPVKLLGSWITIIGTQLDQASEGTTQTRAFHSRLVALEKMQDNIWNENSWFKVAIHTYILTQLHMHVHICTRPYPLHSHHAISSHLAVHRI